MSLVVQLKQSTSKYKAFLSRFISCATKTGIVVEAATKRNGIIKTEMTSDGNYTCGRAIRSGRDSRKLRHLLVFILSVYRHFETPPLLICILSTVLYVLRIMLRIPPVEHRWWSCREKRNNRLVWRDSSSSNFEIRKI